MFKRAKKPAVPLMNVPLPTQKPLTPLKSWIRFRLGFVYMLTVFFFGFVGFRLVQLQVLDNPALEDLAQKQFQKVGKIAPPRLTIFDRNREELAVSVPSTSVFVRPRLLRSKRRTSRILAQVFGGAPEKWLQRIDVQKPFVWIQRQIPEELAHRLARHNLPGIFFEKESKRVYPNGMLAAHVLGFTDVDGNGLSGVELGMNEELLQKPSKYPVSKDGKGNPSYIDKKYFRPDDGKTGVYITIDRRIQNILEEEIEKAMIDTSAKGVYAVVMDPYTGEIYAMGQRPGFDANHIGQYSANVLNNRLISHLFEPGSTMKVLLGARAIQLGLLTPKTEINCENGKLQVGKKTIHEAEAQHRFDKISLEKVIRFSSNIGAVKVARTLGIEQVKNTLDLFALNSKTGIHLPGEVAPAARPRDFWQPLTLATVGFGQGISVTPLQMISAFAPFANGGYLVRPRIFLREGATQENFEVRKVLSPSTVGQMKEILVSVTESGTGSQAQIDNIRIGGKTGTAQKYESGIGYQSGKYLSSFIGFLPADMPDLLIGVMVDEPEGVYFGGQVAAPVFKRIAERSLQVLNRVPKQTVAQSDSFRVLKTELSVPESKLILQTSDNGKWVMPDLKGISVRRALHEMGKYFSHLKVIGNGYLKEQTPPPGTLVSSASSVVLKFSF